MPEFLNLGAAREIQFYVIAVLSLLLVKKFGTKNGYLIALSSTLIAFILSFMLNLLASYKFPWGTLFDYIIPWILTTFIAFVYKKPLSLAIGLIVIWKLVIISWTISGILAFGFPPLASYLWNFITFKGWVMLITLPTITLLIYYSLLKSYKK